MPTMAGMIDEPGAPAVSELDSTSAAGGADGRTGESVGAPSREIAESPPGRSKLGVASAFLMAGILVAVLTTVVIVLVLRRVRWAHAHGDASAGRSRAHRKRQQKQRTRVDAWSESGARANAPPKGWTGRGSGGAAFEPGSNDDTVDLDPDDPGPLGPNDLGPSGDDEGDGDRDDPPKGRGGGWRR